MRFQQMSHRRVRPAIVHSSDRDSLPPIRYVPTHITEVVKQDYYPLPGDHQINREKRA